MKLRVCCKWDLELDDRLVTPYQRGKAHAGYHVNLFRHHDVAYENWCYEYLMGFLPRESTVVEWFGGIGCGSIIIQNMLHPWRHVIYELDPELHAHLAYTFPRCYVVYGDSYQADHEYGGDIHVADNNTFTILRWLRDEQYADFMDKVFGNANYVVFTDTAVTIFYPHRERYARALGVTKIDDLADYVRGLSLRVKRRYGHSVIAAATHSHATYMVFAKEGQPFHLIPRPPKEAKDYLQCLT